MFSLNLLTKLELPMTIYTQTEKTFCSGAHVTLGD